VTFAYDSCTNGIGRLCSITDNTGTTNFLYDLWGRVTSKSQIVGSLTQTMSYAYNSAGQLATVTTPSGRQIVYAYSNNQPVSVTVDGTTVLDSVFYEPFGPNGGWRWGNSTVSVPNTHTRVFDLDFRLKRVTSDLPASGSQPYFDKEIGGNFNAATSHRQPGSTFKPFVYSVLFNKGYTDSTILWDVPIQFNTNCAPDDLETHDREAESERLVGFDARKTVDVLDPNRTDSENAHERRAGLRDCECGEECRRHDRR